MNEQDLVEKLRRIHALYVGATTEGERIAAQSAYARVGSRLEKERRRTPTEYRFTMTNHFQRRLLTALARRHGLRPYRYHRQRHTTVMLQASPDFVDEVLWPEFEQLSSTLTAFLDEVTDRVIAAAVHEDASDASVTAGVIGAGRSM